MRVRLFFLRSLFLLFAGVACASDMSGRAFPLGASCWLSWRNSELMWVEKPSRQQVCSLEDVEDNLRFLQASVGNYYGNLYLLENLDAVRAESLEMQVSSFRDTIGYLRKEHNIEKNSAAKLALLSLFKPSWDTSMKVLRNVCGPSGGLTHQYTLEEALFISLMLPKKPGFLHRTRLDDSYRNDRIFYLSCLAGAVAYMLGVYGKIAKDFFETIEPESDKVQMLVNNVAKLKKAASAVFKYGMVKTRSGWAVKK